MSVHYQRFLKVLESWPVDKTKVGRDFGEHLRKRVKHLINPINLTAETSEDLTKQIESLERLTNNVYGKKYERSFSSTATGLSAEQCSQVLSSEFLQYLNDEKKSGSKF